jgi:hypothetical protein
MSIVTSVIERLGFAGQPSQKIHILALVSAHFNAKRFRLPGNPQWATPGMAEKFERNLRVQRSYYESLSKPTIAR